MDEANEILKDIARDYIEEKMEKNPTIPDFMKDTLVDEEFNRLLHEGETKDEPDEAEAEDCTINDSQEGE
jgi:hypothetical protein